MCAVGAQGGIHAAMLYDTVYVFLKIAHKVYAATKDGGKIKDGRTMYHYSKYFSATSGKFSRLSLY